MARNAAQPDPASEYRPAVRSGLVVRRFGVDAVVWSDLRDGPALLDPVATVMIEVVDGTATTDELIDDAQFVLGVDHYAARAQIKRVLNLFDQAGMLTTSVPSDWVAVEGRTMLPEPDW